MLFSAIRLLGALPVVCFTSPSPSPPIRIINSVTGRAIPYGSIGVKNKPIGTVADGAGLIAAETLVDGAPTDSVVVSCVGFQSRKMVVAELRRQSEIRLTPQAQVLTEVVVRGSSWKRHTIGRDGTWGITYYNFHLAADKEPASQLGREVGTILHVKPGSFVEDAHFYVGRSNFKDLKFRVNVRALDKDDAPAGALLARDVVFSVPNQASGWQHIDLKPYNVNVGQHERVAVTLEWLNGTPESQADGAYLLVPAALSATHRMVFRDKSENRWRVQPINLSLYVTALSPN